MQSSIRVFSLFALWFVMSLAGCEQWAPSDFESTAQALHEEEKMTMSPVTAADYGGSLPLASISCPDAGEKVKAADIRGPVAALLAADEYTLDRITQKIDAAVQNGSGGWSVSNPNTWTPGNAWQTVPALTNNVDVLSKTVDTAENDWFQVTAQFEAMTLGTIAVDDGLARLTEDGAEFGQRVRVSPIPLPISITAFVQAGAAGTKTFTLRINANAAVYMTGPARLDVVNLGKTKDTP